MGIVRTAAGLLFILTACRADTILLNSGVSVGGWNSVTGTNVLIEAHPVWAVTPEARWISYANTGYGGTVATNAPGETPTATFYQDFYMTVDTNRAVGNITVWADDTASVFLDGTLHKPVFHPENPIYILIIVHHFCFYHGFEFRKVAHVFFDPDGFYFLPWFLIPVCVDFHRTVQFYHFVYRLINSCSIHTK